MKYLITLMMLLSLTAGLLSQDILNKKVMDEKSGLEILIGKCDRSGLESGEFGGFFTAEYATYHPDSIAIEGLKGKINEYDIAIVLATWCHDSKEQVGRFFRVLDNAGYKRDDITLICVDRNKLAGDVDTAGYHIERVPTFILSRDGAEAGRITETPVTSLEKDLLLLIP